MFVSLRSKLMLDADLRQHLDADLFERLALRGLLATDGTCEVSGIEDILALEDILDYFASVATYAQQMIDFRIPITNES